MESDYSAPIQHSMMLHAFTTRVSEEMSDQSPETVNNAQIFSLFTGEMQSTEMIVQYCVDPVEVNSLENHPVSNPTTMNSREVSSA